MKNIKTEIVFLIITAFAGLVGFAANTGLAKGNEKGNSLYPTPYPTVYPPPIVGVGLAPEYQGSFSAPGEMKTFQINLYNIGGLGSDTYDLTLSTVWPVTLYAANGSTLLTDTDSDGAVDTGSISQGSSVVITAKVAIPIGAIVGDANTATITATSSLDVSVSKTATLQAAVPAPFAQTYIDETDGAMSLELIQPDIQVVKKASADGYYGDGMAVTAAPNGNFVYVWSKGRCLDILCSIYINEIEYTLLDHSGNTVRAVGKLTDHSGATIYTDDFPSSVAVAPNGTIGIIWARYLYNSSTLQLNYNIYFATLDGAGNLTSGPTNLTNNDVWGMHADSDIPRFESPTIAASDDNHFILSWEEYIPSYNPPYININNIWYTTCDTAGSIVFPPTALTSDDGSHSPILNSLASGNAILTWYSSVGLNYGTPTYAVLNSSGAVSKTATTLGVGYIYQTPDAVQMLNGKVAVAWRTFTGIQYSILNSSYVLEVGPISASGPVSQEGYSLSVTSDLSNHVIMTWRGVHLNKTLLYALGDSTGAFITLPMVYKTSLTGIYTGSNAPYTKFGDVPLNYWSASYIERLYNAGITGGCSLVPLMYCPENTVSRAQMAVFLLRGIHGSGYTPPAVGDSTGFADVPTNHPVAAWIKQLAAEGITGGCGNGNYCPDSTVTRAQMAVFLLRSKYTSAYTPPPADGDFTDVPLDHIMAAWIEQLAAEGITGGCGAGVYCPDGNVTRDQMAVFLVRTFNLP